MVQIHRSTHLDWTGQVFKDLKDLDIDSSIKNLQEMSHNSFKTLAKKQVCRYALKKYKEKKNAYSKMRFLDYSELKMQEYLVSSKFSMEDKKIILRWRIFMERFEKNFRAGRKEEDLMCPLCFLHPDSQSEAFRCRILTRIIEINGNYEDIFGNISLHPKLVQTLTDISKTRSEILQK